MMDRLDCQSRSRCLTCHHFSDAVGCTILASLGHETAKPRIPVESASGPTLASFAEA